MNNLPGLLGFAPGTLAIWAAMLFGVTCALAYLRSMRTSGARIEDLLRKGKRDSGAVEATADRSAYDVCIFPHWNLSLGTVERFVGPGRALQRHAEIASRLRESGWVAQYSAAQDTDIAA